MLLVFILAMARLRATICFINRNKTSQFQSIKRAVFSDASWSIALFSMTDARISAGNVGRFCLSRVSWVLSQNVLSCPLPFAFTVSSRGSYQWFFPACRNKSAVSCEIWMRSRIPVLSILAVVFIVSPKSWKRDRSPLSTPAVTAPECNPIRRPRSPVSGPKLTSNFFTKMFICVRHSLAKRAITRAWSSRGSGRPATAT
mmetsp:Transcript_17798/g.33798  ORF Transcript_17798/g.33798 Transcript_17798/m.33798 type:complete len:200 (+) Transcript_17798:886-1485(+)